MADDGKPTWSSIADWYDNLLVAGSGPHETAVQTVLDLVPPIRGLQVLDVACGQGFASRALAAAGARVIGIDLSRSMIENAIAHGTPSGDAIDYRVDDGEKLTSVETNTMDGVTCQLGLMDLGDLDACLSSIARALRPDGWLVFVIGHPAFLAPDTQLVELEDGRPAVAVTDYFDERFWRSANPNGVRRAGNYHRTLATYLNALSAAGFNVEQAVEPVAGPLLKEQAPLYSRVPIFFAARARLV